ncbi:MAG: glutamate--tRNA ligase [Dehalococcoidia bacterium]|nr:glutamate--tRNA ligase [Dehalococcoidia bacterium]
MIIGNGNWIGSITAGSGLVRVRYAPSPTGSPHVGNIRTALFNWLFARHHGGRFILRIEDTDAARKIEGAEEEIMESLRWLGLDWDEGPVVGGDFGPYRQSERLSIYQDMARRLAEEDKAYYCYCSTERLAEMRAQQAKEKRPPGYDRRCRELPPSQRPAGIPPLVRYKMPVEGKTTFHDLIRGDVTFDNAVLDDFVILKSDGYPTYHLANVVDDYLMEITHVMRADEWIPSTPRHLLLYEACGWRPPLFVHLPIILGPDRAKLSKRHGATSLAAYRDQGYLPEAMLNFLALLGWSLDDKTEVLTKEDIVRHFSLERVGKTAAIFSLEKLDWMNGLYIRHLGAEDLRDRLMPFLDKGLPPEAPRPLSPGYVLAIASLVQERLKKLSDVVELTDFFFVDDLSYDVSLLLGKSLKRDLASQALELSIQRLKPMAVFDAHSLEETLRPLAADLGLKTGAFFGLLRAAVTGRAVTPPLFESMALLGRERVMDRLEQALGRVKAILGLTG